VGCLLFTLGFLGVITWVVLSVLAPHAEPSEGSNEYLIAIHVNRDGHVPLSTLQAIGTENILTNPNAVRSYLKRMYEEDIRAAGGDRNQPPQSAVVFSADPETAFEHLYGYLKIARECGYVRLQVRTQRPDYNPERERLSDGPGYWVTVPVDGEPKKESAGYTLRVTAADDGSLENVELHRIAEKPSRTEFGTDVNACRDELRQLRSRVRLEIDGRLAHREVLPVLDMVSAAGFTEVVLAPAGLKK
jgi:biopolymer transport protein ExbD